jgi:hypothetical protein
MELPPVGTLLELQPGQCDPTVNLFDWVVAVRRMNGDSGPGAAASGEGDACVVAVWPIRGRGPGH